MASTFMGIPRTSPSGSTTSSSTTSTTSRSTTSTVESNNNTSGKKFPIVQTTNPLQKSQPVSSPQSFVPTKSTASSSSTSGGTFVKPALKHVETTSSMATQQPQQQQQQQQQKGESLKLPPLKHVTKAPSPKNASTSTTVPLWSISSLKKTTSAPTPAPTNPTSPKVVANTPAVVLKPISPKSASTSETKSSDTTPTKAAAHSTSISENNLAASKDLKKFSLMEPRESNSSSKPLLVRRSSEPVRPESLKLLPTPKIMIGNQNLYHLNLERPRINVSKRKVPTAHHFGVKISDDGIAELVE